jgi:hypothetical protein
MASIKKVPNQTTENNVEYFKLMNNKLTNLDWARWAGWWDTDGFFNRDKKNTTVRLKLKDRQPVELFANVFEANMYYNEYRTVTPEPYRKEYTAKVFVTGLNNERSIWFVKNVAKFIRTKRDKIFKLTEGEFPIDETPMSQQEFIHYIATVIEGDGSIHCLPVYNKKDTSYKFSLEIKSSNVEFLVSLKNSLEVYYNVIAGGPYETATYTTKKEGVKHKYSIMIFMTQRPRKVSKVNSENIIEFLKDLYKVMTLDRKKNKVIEFLKIIGRLDA